MHPLEQALVKKKRAGIQFAARFLSLPMSQPGSQRGCGVALDLDPIWSGYMSMAWAISMVPPCLSNGQPFAFLWAS